MGFDTTSRLSNISLIEWVEAYLESHGVPHRRIPNAEGSKSSLIATVGPNVAGGIVLSGHTDVVPVDGQSWDTDPFTLVERNGRLHGRGTCDMKGFLALALGVVPDLIAARPSRPVHLALSYDEEIGCLGAPAMIEVLARELRQPVFVVVGEPSDMLTVNGHKSINNFAVMVTGREAHSSLTHLGVSANVEAVRLMALLVALSDRLEAQGDPASPFVPKGATLTIGTINGGTAGNILARECAFLFDLRCPPGFNPQAILAPFLKEAEAMDAALKMRAPEAGVTVTELCNTPPLAPDANGAAEVLARTLAGYNGPPRVVSYVAEAGQFQRAGFSTVICGPGSIEQAHQPNEYVEVSQMERGRLFMRRLVEWASSPI